MNHRDPRDRLINGIIKHRTAVVIVFAVVALVCAAMIPFVGVNYNMVDYLPDEAQSTVALEIMNDEFEQPIPNTNVLVHDVSIAQALAFKDKLAATKGVTNVMWLDDVFDITTPLEMADPSILETYYRDGAALFQVSVAEGTESKVIPRLRALVDEIGSGNAVSGEAAETAQTASSAGEESINAALVLLPAILLLLILSTTSWLEPILFLAAIGVSIVINMGTNVIFGEVSFITFSVSPILQLAVSLDYAIFLLHAFAVERKVCESVEEAMAKAMRSSLSTIAASAITTLFGFMALSFMQFQIGADLGISLVKGIVFSFITVMIFLPALTLQLYKYIDKTVHRPFLPSFHNVGRPLSKVRIPMLIVVVVLLVPAYLGQSHAVFTYQNSEPAPELRFGADTLMIQDEFGQQNAMVILVPRGDVAREMELSRDLKEIKEVTDVISYASMVGSVIPQDFLDKTITEQFYSPNYARIIVYVDTDVESAHAFATVETIRQTTAKYYDTYYTAGQSANLYDMKNIVTVDNVVVSMVAIIAIFFVLLMTFRSLLLPFILLLTIESGIWINLAIPYFTGDTINFVGYLVINTVQLGATIDYAILLTNHYLSHRKNLPSPKAVYCALGETFPSLMVSAGILATAGLALALTSTLSAVSSLGFLLARGAALSFTLVTCFLPALLVLLDTPIRYTTWRANFASAQAVQVNAGLCSESAGSLSKSVTVFSEHTVPVLQDVSLSSKSAVSYLESTDSSPQDAVNKGDKS